MLISIHKVGYCSTLRKIQCNWSLLETPSIFVISQFLVCNENKTLFFKANKGECNIFLSPKKNDEHTNAKLFFHDGNIIFEVC